MSSPKLKMKEGSGTGFSVEGELSDGI